MSWGGVFVGSGPSLVDDTGISHAIITQHLLTRTDTLSGNEVSEQNGSLLLPTGRDGRGHITVAQSTRPLRNVYFIFGFVLHQL